MLRASHQPGGEGGGVVRGRYCMRVMFYTASILPLGREVVMEINTHTPIIMVIADHRAHK